MNLFSSNIILQQSLTSLSKGKKQDSGNFNIPHQYNLINSFQNIIQIDRQKSQSTMNSHTHTPFTPLTDPRLNCKVVCTVTTLTKDVHSAEYLKSIIHPSAHYQLIPASPQTTASQPNPLLEILVQSSIGRIIDIALPFHRVSIGKLAQYYFGRYLFVDGRLRGVRLATSITDKYSNYPNSNLLKWPRGLMQWVAAPQQLTDYLFKRGLLRSKQKEMIPIGDFIFQVRNARIGLLFQSQVLEYPKILSQYHDHGVNMLSVMDDTPFPLTKNGGDITNVNYRAASPFANALKLYASDQIVIYSGMRYATPNDTFLTISSLARSQKFQTGSSSIVNDWSLSMICDLPRNYSNRKQPANLSSVEIVKADYLIRPLKEIPLMEVTKDEVGVRVRQLDKIPKKFGDLKIMLQLLYLYRQINQGRPFTLSNAIDSALFFQFKKLSSLLCLPLSQIINVYKLDSGGNKDLSTILEETVVYQTLQDLISAQQAKRVYIYTLTPFELVKAEHMAYIHSNVIVCSQYLPKLIHQKDTNRIQQINKINSFVDHVIQQPIYDLKQILKIARSDEFQLTIDQQVEAITIKLRNRYRQCFMMTPMANYFLSNQPEQINKDLSKAETSMGINNEGITGHRVIQDQKKKIITKDRQELQKQTSKTSILTPFQKRLEEARKTKKRLTSKLQLKCHVCCNYIQNSFVYRCKQCKAQACFSCIEEVAKITEETKQAFETCIVCFRLCKCVECKGKIRSDFKDIFDPFQHEKVQKIIPEPSVAQNQCPKCEIMGRKSQNIRVMCQSCNSSECLECLRDAKELKQKYRWLCKKCNSSKQNVVMEVQIILNKNDQAILNQEKPIIRDSSILPEPIIAKERPRVPLRVTGPVLWGNNGNAKVEPPKLLNPFTPQSSISIKRINSKEREEKWSQISNSRSPSFSRSSSSSNSSSQSFSVRRKVRRSPSSSSSSVNSSSSSSSSSSRGRISKKKSRDCIKKKPSNLRARQTKFFYVKGKDNTKKNSKRARSSSSNSSGSSSPSSNSYSFKKKSSKKIFKPEKRDIRPSKTSYQSKSEFSKPSPPTKESLKQHLRERKPEQTTKRQASKALWNPKNTSTQLSKHDTVQPKTVRQQTRLTNSSSLILPTASYTYSGDYDY